MRFVAGTGFLLFFTGSPLEERRKNAVKGRSLVLSILLQPGARTSFVPGRPFTSTAGAAYNVARLSPMSLDGVPEFLPESLGSVYDDNDYTSWDSQNSVQCGW